ncbi:MAG: hypothetical protein J3R72DRAFT_518378 [Linnemannia gamsii]|nr:MAG: hypothetical protein J3R72DRAFT_518378 [Linnemannia gamsii]
MSRTNPIFCINTTPRLKTRNSTLNNRNSHRKNRRKYPRKSRHTNDRPHKILTQPSQGHHKPLSGLFTCELSEGSAQPQTPNTSTFLDQTHPKYKMSGELKVVLLMILSVAVTYGAISFAKYRHKRLQYKAIPDDK